MEKKDNYLPDYDYIFKKNKKHKSSFISNVLRKNKKSIILSLLVYIIKAAPVYLIPLLTADIINIVTDAKDNAITRIIIDGIIILLLLIQNIPMNALYHKITDKMLRRTGAGVRSSVVRKLQQLSISYHKEMESGRMQAKFIKDIDSSEMLLTSFVKHLIPVIINLTVAICISIAKSGIVTLFFIVVVPFNVILTRAFRNKIRQNQRSYRKEVENISSQMTVMLEMIPVTKSHGLEDQEIKHMDNEINELKEKALKVDSTNAYFNSFAWCLSNLLSCSCLIFTSILCLTGKFGIEIGDVVLYQSLFGQINGNIQGLINMIPQIAQGSESLTSLNEIMNSEDIEDNENKEEVKDVSGDIEFKNVYYNYPNQKDYVINNFNLSVKKGECIALVGKSGSGKTTIINMIIGLLLASEGDITIDGKSLKNINLSEYRHYISVVPQNAILFPGTIKENITYGLPNYDEKVLEKVIEQANLKEFIDSLPGGVDYSLKEHADNLSGGQKQRITIARALIRNPSILIFDEATSALDSISEYKVQEAISKSIEGRTTFIVAHRLSTIRNADRIIVMDEGKIIESGTYEELMNAKGHFYKLKELNDLSYKKAQEELK